MTTPPRLRVAALGELLPGTSCKFTLTRGAVTPVAMDWVENRFFDAAGAYLVCGTHGATYEPHTGLCVAGPCVGEVLRALPVSVEDGGIWVGGPA